MNELRIRWSENQHKAIKIIVYLTILPLQICFQVLQKRINYKILEVVWMSEHEKLRLTALSTKAG